MTTNQSQQLFVWKRRALLREGISRSELRNEIEAGRLTRVGWGWYSAPFALPQVCAALGRGHRLTCVSALQLHGVWVPPFVGSHETALHLSSQQRMIRNRARRKLPDGVRMHSPGLPSWPDDCAIVPIELALAQAVSCLDALSLAIVLESVVERRLLTVREAENVLSSASGRLRKAVLPLRTDAGSGSETKVVRWLRSHGYSFDTQVVIVDVGRVDIVVGDWLIIECDSRAHHTGEENYQRDRRRDLAAHRSGYRVVRLSFEQVWHEWDVTSGYLREVIRGGPAARP